MLMAHRQHPMNTMTWGPNGGGLSFRFLLQLDSPGPATRTCPTAVLAHAKQLSNPDVALPPFAACTIRITVLGRGPRAHLKFRVVTRHLTSLYDGLRDARCLMSSWQVQDAEARFREFLDATIKKGPQFVTRRGVETAVLVPIEEWRRLQQSSRRNLKSLLLEPGVRFEKLVVERGNLKRRPPVDFK